MTPRRARSLSATQRRGDTVLASVAYEYNAMSRIATTTRGNGTVTTNAYTAQNQLATQTTKNPAGQVLEAHSYTYDAHYNPATRTDTYTTGGSTTPTQRRHLDHPLHLRRLRPADRLRRLRRTAHQRPAPPGWR